MTDALLDAIPGWWHRFGTVLSFSVRRVTDSESWLPRYDGELILTDDGGEVQLRLTLIHVTGEWSLAIGEAIAGLQILDTKEWGYQADARYHIRDFEEGGIDLYCRDIQVEILEGDACYTG